MKTLFSNPPWWQASPSELRAGIRAGSRWPFTMRTQSVPDEPTYGEYLPMPQFLASAAAWCKEKTGSHVVLRDSIARRESYQTYFAYIAREKFDFIVIESATPCWEHDKKVIEIIRQASPQSRIIVTGTITSTRADEVVAAGMWAVKGEYEKGVVTAIGMQAPGIAAHDFLTADEMNSAPFLMYDEEYALTYWDACPSGQKAPHLQIWTSRGCPFKCCFCAFPAVMTNNDPDGSVARKVRFYSPEYIEAIIRHRLSVNPAIKSIYDDSDIFNMGDRHTVAMATVFKKFGLPWTAMCRADTVRPETWNVMKDAGCVGVKIGVESGSQRVIDGIVNKKLDLKKVEEVILPHLKKIGLAVHTTWTVGLPGETIEEGAETIRMIERLYAKGLHATHQLSGTATIEGSPLDSIAQGKHLAAYPEARVEGFEVSGDGQAKIEGIAARSLKG